MVGIPLYKTGHNAKEKDFKDYLKYAARALAYSHARSDEDYDKKLVGYSFEKNATNAIYGWPAFKTNVLSLSENYADQVETDFELFLELRKSGRLDGGG